MKYLLFCLVALGIVVISPKLHAQGFIKTEYIGTSKYKDPDNNEIGGKGDAKIVSGGFKIPLSMKMNENNRPIAWAIGLSGSYASLGKKDIAKDLYPSEILNAQIGLMHMRPLGTKWSLLASIGIGTYMDNTKLSNIRMKNSLGQGGVVFIRHLKPNLDIGGGLALSNTFGYPMVFPAFYFNWNTEGRYQVKITLMDVFEVSGGIKFSKNFNLKLVGEMNGMLALTEKDGKDVMFTHQYVTAGLQPEFVFGKVSIPITLGISAFRDSYYQKRSLKDFFSDKDQPHFNPAGYGSIAIKYSF
jgi:hypothetical protein